MTMDARPNRIRALDAQIVGKIAAGEVVERPALAIKELLENSIDAGATSITVDIEEGGITLFRVTDNGSGIAPEDIRLAFLRYATSKLRTVEDLSAIHTLGFRGEALSAIAAVSRVVMTTRQAGAEHGVRAAVEFGIIQSIEDAASPEGTTIAVRDLFQNTPARLKFLKTPRAEAGLVSDLVMRLILARPDISIRLKSDGKQVYASPGNGKLKDALLGVVGREAVDALTEVTGSAAGCAVHGYVGVGDTARSSRTMQTFLLNGRYVRNAFLSQALEEGCRERVMIGKYPICALHLTMPYDAVDVNVHPNKLEVRFRDERALLEGLSRIIRESFEAPPMRAAPRFFKEAPQDAGLGQVSPSMTPPEAAAAVLNADRPSFRLQDSGLTPRAPQPVVPQPIIPPPEQTTLTDAPRAKVTVRIIGVAWLEYIFAQLGEMLYIIDQHAAHERILYERFRRALDQQIASQQLLVPHVVQLTHREHGALLTSLPDLTASGFEIEDFGERAIQVRAVPMVLGVPQVKDFFGELADRIGEYRRLTTDEKRRDMLVKLACRKAVKAGDPLPLEAIERLIDEMQQTGAPPTCPHGRPIVLSVSKVDLDKRFRRIV